MSHSHPLCRRYALLTACALATTPLFTCRPGTAIVITVDGREYDVSVRTTSADATPQIFQLPELGGLMPWWNNPSLAAQFAMQVFDGLGPGSTAGYGPIFAYERSNSAVAGVVQSLSDPNDQTVVDPAPAPSETLAYAIAGAPVSVPVPAPILGIAAGWHSARQLRRRLRRCSSPAPSQA